MIDLDHIFSYHAPTQEQLPKYDAIRKAARAFAQVIVDNTVECADQTTAIRHISDATMTANRSIALGGRLNK